MLVKVTSLCSEGGYNSVYEVAWEDNLREFIEYYDDEYDIKISEDDIKEENYQGYLEDCAVQWLDVCTDEKITFENVKIIRPKEYNFETDKAEFDMPLSELNLMRELVKKDTTLLKYFKQICNERFKARDGFVPWYNAPNLERNCYSWNKWQLGALFDAYFYDAFEDYHEDCQDYDDAREILNNESFWKCTNKELEKL